MATVTTSASIGSKIRARPGTFEELFEVARLRKTAAAIRKEVRRVKSIDAVDWLDWFVSIEETVPSLSEEIISGRYSPLQPTRYEQAKSHGSFRVMTAFNIRDAIAIYPQANRPAFPAQRRHLNTYQKANHTVTLHWNTPLASFYFMHHPRI